MARREGCLDGRALGWLPHHRQAGVGLRCGRRPVVSHPVPAPGPSARGTARGAAVPTSGGTRCQDSTDGCGGRRAVSHHRTGEMPYPGVVLARWCGATGPASPQGARRRSACRQVPDGRPASPQGARGSRARGHGPRRPRLLQGSSGGTGSSGTAPPPAGKKRQEGMGGWHRGGHGWEPLRPRLCGSGSGRSSAAAATSPPSPPVRRGWIAQRPLRRRPGRRLPRGAMR
jgi:hypothetical protein